MVIVKEGSIVEKETHEILGELPLIPNQKTRCLLKIKELVNKWVSHDIGF